MISPIHLNHEVLDVFHTTIESAGIVVAIICALLAKSLFKIKDSMIVAVIGSVTLVAGIVDSINIYLAIIPLGGYSTSSLEILSWTLSRVLNASILLAGGCFVLRRNIKSFGKNTIWFVLGSSAILSFLFYSLIHIAIVWGVSLEKLFGMQRPLDAAIFVLYGIGFGVFWRISSQYPSVFSKSILYAFIPNLLAQVIMSAGSTHYFDMSFFIAHLLKVVGYSILLYGIQKELITACSILETHNLEMKQVSTYKTEFISTVSHEIRTPIHGIIGTLGLLQKTVLSDQQKRLISLIRDSSSMLSEIINDILDLSKLESNKLELLPTPVDIQALCEQSVHAVLMRTLEKKTPVYGFISPAITGAYWVDATRLKEVFLNLLSNAVKFSPKGVVCFRADLLEDRETSSTFLFEVKDTGIGIAPEYHQKIFEPFTQVDAKNTRKYGGSGLGLAICQKIATKMGGHLSVSSALGQGSTFQFQVTLSKVQESSSIVKTYAAQESPVFVITDDTYLIPILTSYLNFLGVTPKFFGCEDVSGPSFQDQLKAKSPALLIWDGLPNPNIALSNVKTVSLVPWWELGETAEGTQALSKPVFLNDLQLVLSPSDTQKESIINNTDTDLSRTVLVIDDNAINRIVCDEMLKSLGGNTFLEDSGAKGLERVKTDHDTIGCILMDLQMPDMDGIETTRHIKKWESDMGVQEIPIIGVSASIRDEDKQAMKAAGFCDFLAKPFTPEALQIIIRKWA